MKADCSSEYETEIFVLSKLSMGLERNPEIGMFENCLKIIEKTNSGY